MSNQLMASQTYMATLQKALALNLDQNSYGTIAEIGAGQEVARCFFRAGGAAGTIAKSMSAYDMKVSDSIYGEGMRYVSRDRLHKMLSHEYTLLVDRLASHRSPQTQFFSFADTVAARSYKTKGDGHGWMGISLQLYPGAEPSTLVIHVKMLDESAEAQQDALGILGVNLIYGAYNFWRNPRQLMCSLKDNLFEERPRISIDLVEMSGNCWDGHDSRTLNMYLLEEQLTSAVMFNKSGQPVLAQDELYKKSALVVRGNFRPATTLVQDIIKTGLAAFSESIEEPEDRIAVLAEISTSPINARRVDLSHASSGAEPSLGLDIPDFLGRVDTLVGLGCSVIVTRFGEFYRFRQYLHSCTKRDAGIVISCRNVHDIFNENYYTHMEGGILEAFGKLFTGGTRLYVYPAVQPEDASHSPKHSPGDESPTTPKTSRTLETLDNIRLPERQHHLLDHLRFNKFLFPLENYDRDLVENSMDPTVIRNQMLKGDGPWKESCPDSVYAAIKAGRLFGYGSI